MAKRWLLASLLALAVVARPEEQGQAAAASRELRQGVRRAAHAAGRRAIRPPPGGSLSQTGRGWLRRARDGLQAHGAPAMKAAMAGGGTGGGTAAKKKKTSSPVPSDKMIERWLTFWYWRPMIFSLLFLIIVVEIFGPILNVYMEFGLGREVLLLSIAIIGMTVIIVSTLDPGAAGMMNLLAVATIGCTMVMLLVMFTVSVKLRRTNEKDPIMLLATDTCQLFRPLLRLILVALVLDVVSKEANVDWGQLAVLMGYMMLGVALSISGVIGDILGHIFIRMDDHFKEGDFVLYGGSLVQIEELHWRHTIGIAETNQARIYIPNNELVSAAIVNKSQDTGREVEVSIPVNMDSENLKQALQNAWDLLQRTGEDDFTFEGLDGRTYENQFSTDDCTAWINETCDAITITFVGKYFFSDPPPYEGKGEEAEKVLRQQEWEHGWAMQVEWYNLQLKKMNEKLGAWPFRADRPSLASESA